VTNGWVQDTVGLAGGLSPEVDGWIAQLTSCQRDPSAPECTWGSSSAAGLTCQGSGSTLTRPWNWPWPSPVRDTDTAGDANMDTGATRHLDI